MCRLWDSKYSQMRSVQTAAQLFAGKDNTMVVFFLDISLDIPVYFYMIATVRSSRITHH